MGEQTGISWCDGTFNPWWGCTEVSPACGGDPWGGECYAKTWDRRVGGNHWGTDKDRRFFGDKHWAEPLKWNRDAAKAGERRRIFCMSMGDWAEGRFDQQSHLVRLYGLIEQTTWLDWLMLTKRPQLIRTLLPKSWQIKVHPNVWQGVTAENQYWLDNRWEFLKSVRAEIYWLSIEPMFEAMRLPWDFLELGPRAWVIVGGQSGPGAKPLNPDWVRGIRDQCVEAGSLPYVFPLTMAGDLHYNACYAAQPVGCAVLSMELRGIPSTLPLEIFSRLENYPPVARCAMSFDRGRCGSSQLLARAQRAVLAAGVRATARRMDRRRRRGALALNGGHAAAPENGSHWRIACWDVVLDARGPLDSRHPFLARLV